MKQYHYFITNTLMFLMWFVIGINVFTKEELSNVELKMLVFYCFVALSCHITLRTKKEEK